MGGEAPKDSRLRIAPLLAAKRSLAIELALLPIRGLHHACSGVFAGHPEKCAIACGIVVIAVPSESEVAAKSITRFRRIGEKVCLIHRASTGVFLRRWGKECDSSSVVRG
jgi:hypothetical protein